MRSEFSVPGTDQPLKKRSLITLVDDDHHSMVTFMEFPGQAETKRMEVTYVRKM
jgi:hypothetical protein